MIDLGALRASITLDDKEATKKIKEFGEETEKSSSKLSGFLSNVGDKAKTAILGFGGAIGTAYGSMVGMTAKTLETTSNIEKFSATCNVSREEFQKLDGVFQQMGWSMEGSAGDFAMLSEKMLEASQTGEGEAYEMFTKLGVAVDDSSGKLRNTGDVFNDMILALQNVSNETERQAIASIMLGTTSEELAPLLKMTNEEFLAMKDNVNVISDEQLDKAKEFKASWDNLKQTFSTVVTEIGISLMPIFSELADWVVEHMPEIQTVIETAFNMAQTVVNKVVEVISENFMPIIETLYKYISDNMPKIKKFAEDTFNTLSKVIKVVTDNLNILIPILAGAVAGIVAFKVISTAVTLFTSLKTVITTVSTAQGILNAVMSANPIGLLCVAIGALVAAGVALYMNWDTVKAKCSELWSKLTEWFRDITNRFNDMWKDIKNFGSNFYNAGKEIFSRLWDGLKSIWSNISSWVSDKVSWITDKLSFWNNSANKMNSSSISSKGRSIVDTYALETNNLSRATNTTNNTQTVNITVNATVRNQSDIDAISKRLQADFTRYNRALGTV